MLAHKKNTIRAYIATTFLMLLSATVHARSGSTLRHRECRACRSKPNLFAARTCSADGKPDHSDPWSRNDQPLQTCLDHQQMVTCAEVAAAHHIRQKRKDDPRGSIAHSYMFVRDCFTARSIAGKWSGSKWGSTHKADRKPCFGKLASGDERGNVRTGCGRQRRVAVGGDAVAAGRT
jgi:hypothetical protein